MIGIKIKVSFKCAFSKEYKNADFFNFSLLFCDVLFWTLRKIIRRTIILLKGKNNKSVRSTCHLKKPKEKIANQELAKIADDGSEDWLENDETVNLGEIWSRFANCAAHFGS